MGHWAWSIGKWKVSAACYQTACVALGATSGGNNNQSSEKAGSILQDSPLFASIVLYRGLRRALRPGLNEQHPPVLSFALNLPTLMARHKRSSQSESILRFARAVFIFLSRFFCLIVASAEPYTRARLIAVNRNQFLGLVKEFSIFSLQSQTPPSHCSHSRAAFRKSLPFSTFLYLITLYPSVFMHRKSSGLKLPDSRTKFGGRTSWKLVLLPEGSFIT
jgi:hypothetical protein